MTHFLESSNYVSLLKLRKSTKYPFIAILCNNALSALISLKNKQISSNKNN
jgi:hypothetical protein